MKSMHEACEEMSLESHPLSGMVRKLGKLITFSEADCEALADLPNRTQTVGAGTYLVREGGATTETVVAL